MNEVSQQPPLEHGTSKSQAEDIPLHSDAIGSGEAVEIQRSTAASPHVSKRLPASRPYIRIVRSDVIEIIRILDNDLSSGLYTDEVEFAYSQLLARLRAALENPSW